MKAFLISIVLLLVVSLGAAFIFDRIWSTSSGDTYVSDNVRRN
jgi:hypothetical protein